MAVELRSPAWGNIPLPITQEFGKGFRPDWYQYSKDLGYPAGWHVGYDIGMPKGTPIYALNYGTVVHAGFSDSFRPNPVRIMTDDNPATPQNEAGYEEIYGHLWTANVNKGQKVKPGQRLGLSGEQTRKGTMIPDGSGPHLHFELRRNNPGGGQTAVDSRKWLQEGGDPNAQPGSGEYPVIDGLPSTGSGPFDFSGLESKLSDYAKRAVLAIVGLALLGFGLNALLSTHAGVNGGRVVRKSVKAATAVASPLRGARTAVALAT